MSGDVSNEAQILQWWDPDTDRWIDSSSTYRVTGMSLADAWVEADKCTGFDMQYRIAVRRTGVISTIAASRPEPELKWEVGKTYHSRLDRRYTVTTVGKDGYGVARSDDQGEYRFLITPGDRKIYVEAEGDENDE